ncbi:hypothetical protein AcW1_001105 [Taiwanofungus camphoratus]|nr:hypothetical protein AcV5_005023 [Antrodia cinnamomea]KAI0962248.1 hypothetical protein AcV7_001129 [Antrodia cinnamomea]KAI0964242.1 hypothetical protein AcW1_001105 [Antrodia cinnamomea]
MPQTTRLLSMSRSITVDSSPPIHRGMVVLDKDAFRKSVTVLAAKVPPIKAGVVLEAKEMKKSLINVRRVKSVWTADDGDRLVLTRFSDETDLPPEALIFLENQSAQLVTHKLDFDYDYYSADDILHSILPEELVEGAPSGFAAVGHIAHLNLEEEYHPYKYLIGQLILEKNPSVRTVVNKADTISNQFRVFKMELLAGESNYIVEHSEHRCRFTFDFSEVYWNSRLHHEHARLVDHFKPEDVIADVFAGVGPFALPAAKKGCGVFANDLNPSSHKYLQYNIEDNKVTKLVRASCKDGRAFVRAVFNRAIDEPLPPASPPKSRREQKKERLQQQRERSRSPAHRLRSVSRDSTPPPAPPRRRITHFVMNLPESAVEFLDAFRGVLSPQNVGMRNLSGIYDADSLPMVHCYCFTRELEPEKAEADIRQRVEQRLGHPLGQEVLIHMCFHLQPAPRRKKS